MRGGAYRVFDPSETGRFQARGQLGFQGLVMTDSLSAGALVDIGYTVPKAVVAAITAGADMVLYTAAAASVASLTASTAAATQYP